MTRTIITGPMLPPIFKLAAEGGGGGGATPPVITPAPAAAPPDPSLADTAVIDFTPPPIDLSAIEGKTPAAIEPTPPPKTPAAPEPGKTPPAPKPNEPPKPPVKPDNSPAGLMRAELEKVKGELAAAITERDDLKGKFEKGDPRLEEAKREVEAKAEELKKLTGENEKFRREQMMQDPRTHPEVIKLMGDYEQVATRFYSRVPELNQQSVNGLVQTYAQLPFGKPEYAQARAAWEKTVNAALGGTDEAPSRRIDQAVDFIEKTLDFSRDHQEAVTKARTDVEGRYWEAEKASHKERITKIRQLAAKAKEVPEDTAQLNVELPSHALALFDRSFLSDEQKAKFNEGIPQYVELVMAGLEPKADADFTGMDAAQIKAARTADAAKMGKAHDSAVHVMTLGLEAFRRFPVLVKELIRLREKLGEKATAEPPDPTKQKGGEHTPGEAQSIEEYKAPPIPGQF